jgi:alpha-D-xyloside xylohydrolase
VRRRRTWCGGRSSGATGCCRTCGARRSAACGSATPLLRPLVFDWLDDPSTHGIVDEFLLGEHLLVAPVLTEDDRRRVYLPAGRWLDLRTGRVRRGPQWIEVRAPLAAVPLYLRADAVLPLAGPAQHTEQLDWTRLRLEVFPVRSGRFVVDRSRAGLPPVTVTHSRDRDRVRVDVTGDGAHELALRGIARPARVTVDGEDAPWQWVDRAAVIALAGPGRVEATLSRR